MRGDAGRAVLHAGLSQPGLEAVDGQVEAGQKFLAGGGRGDGGCQRHGSAVGLQCALRQCAAQLRKLLAQGGAGLILGPVAPKERAEVCAACLLVRAESKDRQKRLTTP